MKSIKGRGDSKMNKRKQNIELKFSDGTVSKIDERVHRLILSYQREIQNLRKTLPPSMILRKISVTQDRSCLISITFSLNIETYQDRNCFKICLYFLFMK